MSKWLIDTKQIKQNKNQDLTHEKNEIEIAAKKHGINFRNIGCICLILSSFSLIGAAVFYAPYGPDSLLGTFMQSSSRELTLPLIIFSVALFTLGSILILYEKLKR